MLLNQGRDSTIDPYYFSKLNFASGGATPEEIEKLQKQIDALNDIVNGTLIEPGLVDRTSSLETIVQGLQENGAKIQIKTSDEWEAQEDQTSYLNLIYVYQDIDGDTITQKLKVGDGVTKLKDLPFVANSAATTVTQQEKDFWNNKVSVSLDSENESMIFTTN